MNMGDQWWVTQDQLPAGATIVPVIFASDKSHLINLRAISMDGISFSQLGILEKISTMHQRSVPGFLSG
jgi:hypothetical protein